MAEPQFDDIANEFRQALIDCRQLYHSATQQCVEHHPAAVGDSPQALIELMEDLGKGITSFKKGLHGEDEKTKSIEDKNKDL